jgi:hypothetical protein
MALTPNKQPFSGSLVDYQLTYQARAKPLESVVKAYQWIQRRPSSELMGTSARTLLQFSDTSTYSFSTQ